MADLRSKILSEIYKDLEDFKSSSWKIIPGRGEIIFEVKVGGGDLNRGFVSIFSLEKFIKFSDMYELKKEDCYSLVQKTINFFMAFFSEAAKPNTLLVRTLISVQEYPDLLKSHIFLIKKDGDTWMSQD